VSAAALVLSNPSAPLRAIPGGKGLAKARKPRAVRPLFAHEALCLAWMAGLVHDERHPYSEVLIDEGSIPVELSGDVVSSEVFSLFAIGARNFLEVTRTADGELLHKLTPSGLAELRAQRSHGHLKDLLPLPPEAPEAPGFEVIPCAIMRGEFLARCHGCKSLLSGRQGWTQQQANEQPVFAHGWHPTQGCPACQRAAAALPTASSRYVVEYDQDAYNEERRAIEDQEWGGVAQGGAR